MPETNAGMLSSKDQINILLKEYDTLRAEILSRMSHRWQMLGLIGVIITFISAQSGAIVGRVIAGVMAAGLLGLWVNSVRDVSPGLHGRFPRLKTSTAWRVNKRLNGRAPRRRTAHRRLFPGIKINRLLCEAWITRSPVRMVALASSREADAGSQVHHSNDP